MNIFAPLRRLYDWTMQMAAHPHAIWYLAAVAFAESSFFPIPQDVMMIPMILAARHQAFKIAAVATVASVSGGMFGYFIGTGLYDVVGRPIIDFYGYAEKYSSFQGLYDQWGEWIVAAGAFTPIPYKVITIASGVAEMDFFTFSWVSLIGRGARFFALALLLWFFGEPIRRFIENRFGLMSTLFFVIVVGGFVAIKFII